MRATPIGSHAVRITHVNTAPTYSLVGDVYALILSGQDTAGSCTLLHALISPGGGPPFHTHTREDEHFHILEGELTFFARGHEHVAGPGETVFLPRGLEHRFENCSPRTVRALIQCTPAGMDAMIAEAGTPLAPGSTTPATATEDDVPRLIRACERAGIRLNM